MRAGIGWAYPGAFRYLIDYFGPALDRRLCDQLFELLRGEKGTRPERCRRRGHVRERRPTDLTDRPRVGVQAAPSARDLHLLLRHLSSSHSRFGGLVVPHSSDFGSAWGLPLDGVGLLPRGMFGTPYGKRRPDEWSVRKFVLRGLPGMALSASSGDPPGYDGDPLGPQAVGLLDLVAGDQTSGGSDHPPPREPLAPRQHSADRARGPRVPGLLGDLTVSGHFPSPQRGDDASNGPFEIGQAGTGAV
jgi:hypothetical protein